jgi:hypothetical protein
MIAGRSPAGAQAIQQGRVIDDYARRELTLLIGQAVTDKAAGSIANIPDTHGSVIPLVNDVTPTRGDYSHRFSAKADLAHHSMPKSGGGRIELEVRRRIKHRTNLVDARSEDAGWNQNEIAKMMVATHVAEQC